MATKRRPRTCCKPISSMDSDMNALPYALFFALIGITVFNLIATSSSKRRNKANEMKYNNLFHPIEKRLLELEKRNNCSFNKVARVLNDLEEPIVIVRDDARRIAAIAMKDFQEIFHYEAITSVRLARESGADGKKFNAAVEVEASGRTLVFPMATKGYSKHSLSGKACLDMAGKFSSFLSGLNERQRYSAQSGLS